MKGKLGIIFMAMLLGLSGCTLGIVDGSLQTSKSIQQSKRNNFFVSEYMVEQKPEGIFKITEAWEEKSWGYKVHNIFSAEKIILPFGSTELLFDVDTSANAKYTYANFADWQLDDVESTKSVGFHSGVYRFSLQDKPSPDTVKLKLMAGSIGERKQVGELTFIRKR